MYDGRLKSTTSKDKVSFDQMNLSTILSESKIQRVEKEINVVLEKEVFYKDILKVIDSRLNELSLANKDSNLELQ